MDLYDTDDSALILKLQYQLSYLGKNEGDSMQDHITEVTVVRDQLASTGQEANSAQLAPMVLYWQTQNYMDLVTTATTRERFIMFEEFETLLIQ